MGVPSQAVHTGQRVSLTTNCQTVSNWLPNGTNAVGPVKEVMQERG